MSLDAIKTRGRGAGYASAWFDRPVRQYTSGSPAYVRRALAERVYLTSEPVQVRVLLSNGAWRHEIVVDVTVEDAIRYLDERAARSPVLARDRGRLYRRRVERGIKRAT